MDKSIMNRFLSTALFIAFAAGAAPAEATTQFEDRRDLIFVCESSRVTTISESSGNALQIDLPLFFEVIRVNGFPNNYAVWEISGIKGRFGVWVDEGNDSTLAAHNSSSGSSFNMNLDTGNFSFFSDGGFTSGSAAQAFAPSKGMPIIGVGTCRRLRH